MQRKKELSNVKRDVLIVGDLCDIDLTFADYLERLNIHCIIARPSQKQDTMPKSEAMNLYTRVAFFKTPVEFYRLCLSSRLVVSFTAGVIAFLRHFYLLRFIHFPPIINVATGSDIAELIDEKTLLGRLYRFHLRTSSLNWLSPYPHGLQNIIKYKIPRVVFINHPFGLDENELTEAKHVVGGPVRYFHPSNLDWRVNDPGANRKSSKGNDRFLKAFIRALREGLNGICIILDRGPDREIAKEMIRDSGFSKHFIWKPHLSRDELFYEYRNADVVVDQFDVGCLGGIGAEAMSCGKAVMVYLNEECTKLVYADPPPVLNCYTEDQIYEEIMKSRDRNGLEMLGRKSREWVFKYHHWSACLRKFMFYYTLLTGHKVIDYGWDRNPYTES